MNKFEAVLIFSPELPTKNITEEIDKFKDFITNSSGSIINEEDWGLREIKLRNQKIQKHSINIFSLKYPEPYLIISKMI